MGRDKNIRIVDGKYHKRCEVCFKYFVTKKSHLQRRRTCSKACDSERKRSIYKGKNNPNYGNRGESNPIYKGGFINSYGYKMIRMPNHPNSNKDGYIMEHRLIMSEHLGRPLTVDEIVHHKDENKLNNNKSNLEIMTRSEHARHHSEDFEIMRCRSGRIEGTKRVQPLPPVQAYEIEGDMDSTSRGEKGFGSTGV